MKQKKVRQEVNIRHEIARLITLGSRIIKEQRASFYGVYTEAELQARAFMQAAAALIIAYEEAEVLSYEIKQWDFMIRGDYDFDATVSASSLLWAKIKLIAGKVDRGDDPEQQGWCQDGWLDFAAGVLMIKEGETIHSDEWNCVLSLWNHSTWRLIFDMKIADEREFEFTITLAPMKPDVFTIGAPTLELAILRLLAWDLDDESYPGYFTDTEGYLEICELARSLTAHYHNACGANYVVEYREITDDEESDKATNVLNLS